MRFRDESKLQRLCFVLKYLKWLDPQLRKDCHSEKKNGCVVGANSETLFGQPSRVTYQEKKVIHVMYVENFDSE